MPGRAPLQSWVRDFIVPNVNKYWALPTCDGLRYFIVYPHHRRIANQADVDMPRIAWVEWGPIYIVPHVYAYHLLGVPMHPKYLNRTFEFPRPDEILEEIPPSNNPGKESIGTMPLRRDAYTDAVKRPIEFSPQVQPMIPTPTHGSLPSGHATEAFLMARILWRLLIESKAPQYSDRAYWGTMLMRQASRIATNRTVAGVHFPVDSVAGATLGLTLADHVHAMCRGGGWTSATLNTPNFDPEQDFDWHQLYSAESNEMAEHAVSDRGVWLQTKHHDDPDCEGPSPALTWLWNKALDEWRDLDSMA